MSDRGHLNEHSGRRPGVLNAVAWQGAGRMSERAIRFVVNIALARMLSPDDFGTFAAILVPLIALDSITYLATGPFIIQSGKGDRPSYLNSILLFSVARGLLISVMVVVLAPLLADFFERPELAPFFMFGALQPLLAGFLSPGIHLLEKRLQYARVSGNQLFGALTGAGLSLVLALIDPSPWALLIGQVVGVGMVSVGSWVVAPIRVGFSIDRQAISELKAFALGAIGTPILIMLVSQAPAVLLGRMDSLAALGVFTLAYRLAELPVYIALTVVGSVLLPAYSRFQADPVRLRVAWLRAWRVISMYSIVLSLSIAWMGDSLPLIVWGARFVPGSGLMPILALIGFLSSLLAVTGPLFWGVGRPAIDRMMQVIRVLIVYICGVLLVSKYAESGLAWSLVLGLIGALLLAIPSALRITGASIPCLLRQSIPMIVIGVILLAVLTVLDRAIETSDLARVVSGGVVLLTTLLVVSLLTFRRFRGSFE